MTRVMAHGQRLKNESSSSDGALASAAFVDLGDVAPPVTGAEDHLPGRVVGDVGGHPRCDVPGGHEADGFDAGEPLACALGCLDRSVCAAVLGCLVLWPCHGTQTPSLSIDPSLCRSSPCRTSYRSASQARLVQIHQSQRPSGQCGFTSRSHSEHRNAAMSTPDHAGHVEPARVRRAGLSAFP